MLKHVHMFRRAVHMSVYDKNSDDQGHPTAVPDEESNPNLTSTGNSIAKLRYLAQQPLTKTKAYTPHIQIRVKFVLFWCRRPFSTPSRIWTSFSPIHKVNLKRLIVYKHNNVDVTHPESFLWPIALYIPPPSCKDRVF